VVLVTAQGFPWTHFRIITKRQQNCKLGGLQAEQITKDRGCQPPVLRFPSGFSRKNRPQTKSAASKGSAKGHSKNSVRKYFQSYFHQKILYFALFLPKPLLPALTPRSGGANLNRR
jgi:hypothetical protein